MTRTSIALAWALLLVACDRHHAVDTIPAELVRKEVRVSTRDGRTVDAVALQGRDGRRWVTLDGEVIPTGEVVSASRPNYGRAVLRGMGAGALVGVVAGIVVGAIDGGSCGEKSCTTAGQAATALGILGALVGVPIGTVIGLVVGSDDVYDVSAVGPAARLSVVPGQGGGRAALTWEF